MTKCDQGFILQWAKKIKAINALGEKCSKCKCDNIFSLEFHHLGIDKKEKDISRLIVSGGRWSNIEEELKKCVLFCRNCHSEYHCERDSRNHKIKEKLLINLDVLKCSKCGYHGENFASLQFHHVGEDKKFMISDIINRKINVSAQDLIKELGKCILLCSNCHVKEQIDMKKFEKYSETIHKRAIEYVELNSPVDVGTVKQMLKDGYKQIEIANELKYAKSTISDVIKRNGLH